MSVVFGRKGVVAELLVVVVILASMGVLIMTFENAEDTPNISRAVLDAIVDLQDRISQGILEWLAGGISDAPLACNGLYPLSNNLSSMEDEIYDSILPYLPDDLITDGVITIDLGLLTGVEFDEDGLQILIDQGGIVYDDGQIYAEDELSQDLSFALRIPYFLDRVENWTMCDHGDLGNRLAEALGEECFYGKKNLGCGDVEHMRIGQDDIDFILGDGPTVAKVVQSLSNSIKDLDAYFNGSLACGGAPTEPSGITCTFEMRNLSMINSIYPYVTEDKINGEEIVGPKYELARFNGYIHDRVNSLPFTKEITHYQDYELGCTDVDRVSVPSSILYSDTVNPLIEAGQQDLIAGDFPLQAYPGLFVNTTRGASFEAIVTCNDPAITLLGNPVEYSFRFLYGVKQHCGPPDALEKTADEAVCSPCGIPPQVGIEDCVGHPCSPKVQKCKDALEWLRQYAHDFYGDTTYDYLQDIYDLGIGEWNDYKSEQCDIDQDDLENCRGGIMSHVRICCLVPGYVDPDSGDKPGSDDSCSTSFDPNNPNCFMDIADFKATCTGPSDCGRVETWTLGDYCVDTSCQPQPGGGVCEENPPEQAYTDGRSCQDDTGCYWCSDGSSGQDAGVCSFNPNREGEVCDDSFPCSTRTCQSSYHTFGPGCWTDPSLNAGTDVNCDSVYRGTDLLRCMVAFCNGDGGCDREYDPSQTGQRCDSRSETFPCPNGGGSYTCTYDVLCEPSGSSLGGGCSDVDEGSADCGTCATGGGGCVPGSDGCT